MFDDDINEQDLMAYGLGGAGSRNKQSRRRYDDEEEDAWNGGGGGGEGYNDYESGNFKKPANPTHPTRPIQSIQKRRSSDFGNTRPPAHPPTRPPLPDDYDDDDNLSYMSSFQTVQPHHSRRNGILLQPVEPYGGILNPETILSGLTLIGSQPLQLGSFDLDGSVAPHAIRRAAETLLESHKGHEIALNPNTLDDLRKLLQCQDEYTCVDPPIVLCDTLSTGLCNVYLKEVVPVSILCMARCLKCRYQTEILEGMSSNPKPYDEVGTKPFRGAMSGLDHVQPLYCETTVRGALEDPEDAFLQVSIYMMRIGRVSSQEAADVDFIEKHTKGIAEIIVSGKKQVKRARGSAASGPASSRRLDNGDDGDDFF